MWNRRDVDFIQSQDIPWTYTKAGEFGEGELQRLLSRDAGDGACTVISRFRNRQAGALTGGADVYILEGDGTLNGFPMEPGHYFYIPPGTIIDCIPGAGRTTLYMGFFAAPELRPDGGARRDIHHAFSEDLAWTTPTWSGDTPLAAGVSIKWLRRDERGDLMLAGFQPGWKSEPEEAHPVWEEAFRLYGDLLQGARGRMRAGAYSFRSPDVWHAPLYTRGGTLSLTRSSAPSTTVFRDPAPGRELDALVRTAYAGFESPAL
jgi:hypothetical protein